MARHSKSSTRNKSPQRAGSRSSGKADAPRAEEDLDFDANGGQAYEPDFAPGALEHGVGEE